MLNKQKIYDDVVKALYEQGEKSVDHPGSNMCRYRKFNDDGSVLKCGIGHIIPDDKYDPEIDDMCIRAGYEDVRKLIDSAIYGEVNLEKWSNQDDRGFLNQVQRKLHDELEYDGFRENLIEAAEDFAVLYDLKPYNFS